MKNLLWSALGLAIWLAFPAGASADITRGCKANFQIVVTQHKGGHGSGKLVGIIDDFDAAGSCKNKFKANTCRERAKNLIFGCAKDYWHQRNRSALPTSCKLIRGSTGVRGLGPFKRSPVTRSQFDLRYAIEFVTCCQLQTADEVVLNVQAVSHGDKGCGKHRNQGSVGSGKFMETFVMARGFKANCKRLRSMGWCS